MTRERDTSPRVCILAWVVLVGLWAGAFVVTHVPPSRLSSIVSLSDKVLHAAGYLALTCALLGVLKLHGPGGARRMLTVVAIVAAYGAVDELTQPLVGRHADIIDWLADVTGAGLGVVLWITARAVVHRLRSAPSSRE